MDGNIEARRRALMDSIKQRLFLDIAFLRNNSSYLPEDQPQRFIKDVQKPARTILKHQLMQTVERETLQKFMVDPDFVGAEEVLELLYRNFKQE